MKAKRDEAPLEALDQFVLGYEEVPLYDRRKNKKNNQKQRVLGNRVDLGLTYHINNRFKRRQQAVQRRRGRLSYVTVNGKQVPVYPPSFFRH